jgi:DNA topoisomerase-1
MEDELDAVSRGEEPWTIPLEKFWKPFIRLVEKTEKNVSREEVAQARELGKDPVSGKPVTVRMGRYGPFVQIGSKDDEEKPRFAGLRPGQKMDAITLEQGLALFVLPRTLGQTAAGETVVANVGRFGPYVKYGDKYVSLKEDDPYTVSLERALEVIRLKQEADANRIIADFGVDGIQVLNGRYGPYVTDGKKNAKIPKDRDPKSLTLPECRTLIEQAPERGRRFGRGRRGAPAGATAAATGASTGRSAAKAGAPKDAVKARTPAGAKAPPSAAAPTRTPKPRPAPGAAARAQAAPRAAGPLKAVGARAARPAHKKAAKDAAHGSARPTRAESVPVHKRPRASKSASPGKRRLKSG